MKQVVIPRYGPPEVMEMREAPDPLPGPHEVRIAVRASGVNFADVLARSGLYPDGPKPPAVVGYEVAGVIDSLGSGVVTRSIGDRVLALTRFGGYSTSVIVPAQHARTFPQQLSFAEAAAIPVSYLTAYVSLFTLGNLQEGETVLLHGAGGSVGLAAIELIRYRKAKVIGTASAGKHAAIRAFGVENVFDPREVDVSPEVLRLTAGRGADVVLDPIGGRHFRESYRLLAPLGRLVVFGAASAIGVHRSWWRAGMTLLRMPTFRPMSLIHDNRGVLGLNLGKLWTEEQRVDGIMTKILNLVETGQLQPMVWKTLPLTDVAKAHRLLHDRANIGKIVLTMP